MFQDKYEFSQLIAFLTNAKQLSALDIANLYKKRWLIELFFKWLNQPSEDKKVLGYNGERCSHTNQ